MSSEMKPAGLQFTKLAASAVGCLVLYKLWNNNKTATDNNDYKLYPNITIQSLHVYPVKSLQGFEVESWPISKYGLKYDREWMIYNPKSKRFLTQKDLSKLVYYFE